MASRGSIPKMTKPAGIDMLPAQVGIAALPGAAEPPTLEPIRLGLGASRSD